MFEKMMHTSDMATEPLSGADLRSRVLDRIAGDPQAVWTPSDFADLASRAAVQRPLDLRQRKHDPYGTHGQDEAVAFHHKARHPFFRTPNFLSSTEPVDTIYCVSMTQTLQYTTCLIRHSPDNLQIR